MYLICFASRENSTTNPATRWMEFVANSTTEFKVNLALARKRTKNIRFECVRIRHDGTFHMEIIPIENFE